MASFYANVTLSGPPQDEIARVLNERNIVAYLSTSVRGAAVVFPEDLSAQEQLARDLSAHFQCPALLVLNYGDLVLLYHLYVNGEQIDAYVSTPHDDLDTGGDPVPEGNAETLCMAFGMEHAAPRVERVLRRPTHPSKGYALAVNRHGELARALGLPVFAAGASFRGIEIGELPEGPGFDPARLVRTGR